MTNETRAELNELSDEIHENVSSRGYWEIEDELAMKSRKHLAMVVLSKMALINAELAEATEAVRKTPFLEWNSMSDHSMVRELSGTLVRIIDLARWLELDLWRALEKELEYNEKRPKDEGKAA